MTVRQEERTGQVRGWVLLDEQTGEILEFSRTAVEERPPPWRPLSLEDMNRLRLRPGSYRAGRAAPAGRKEPVALESKTRVRVSVDVERFLADGQDRAQVMVVGPRGSFWPVTIRINGIVYQVDRGEVLVIRSETPGAYQIALADRRVYADPARITTIAAPPEE